MHERVTCGGNVRILNVDAAKGNITCHAPQLNLLLWPVLCCMKEKVVL